MAEVVKKWDQMTHYEARAAWTEALRSGRFTQGRGTLCRILDEETREYCCLGVACKVAIEHGMPLPVEENALGGSVQYAGHCDELPSCVADWLGTTDAVKLPTPVIDHCGEEALSLIDLNDDLKYSFEQIADVIDSMD